MLLKYVVESIVTRQLFLDNCRGPTLNMLALETGRTPGRVARLGV